MTTPLRPEHANKAITLIPGASSRFSLNRVLTGYSYPVNGNVHNPTPKYMWNLLLDDRLVGIFFTAREAKDAARDGFALDESLA